jgi:hypothetical protein
MTPTGSGLRLASILVLGPGLAGLAAPAAPAGVQVRFLAPQVTPPTDLPPDARLAGTRSPPAGTDAASGVVFRTVPDVSDHGPPARVVGGRIETLGVSWWDRTLFPAESAVEAYLQRLLASSSGSTTVFVPWAQRLPAPSVAATAGETGGRRGRLLLWYAWPSVYLAHQDGDATWWFGYWLEREDVRLAGPILAPAGAGTVTVGGLQDGQPVVLRPEAEARIAALALETLRSASYEAPPAIATERRWTEARQASHLHLSFRPARTVTFRFSTTGPAAARPVEVAEMLIAISKDQWPDYLLVRERGRVRAFAKYHPGRAQALRDALGVR